MNGKEEMGYDKSWMVVVLLSFFLGQFGVDRFYVGKTGPASPNY